LPLDKPFVGKFRTELLGTILAISQGI